MSPAFLRLQRIFREVLEDDGLQLSGVDTPATIPGWDSFAHVKLMIGVEEEFGIKLLTDEVATTLSAGALLDLIEKKTGVQA